MKRPRDIDVIVSDLVSARDLLDKAIPKYAANPDWSAAIRCARTDVQSALADLKGIGIDPEPPTATEYPLPAA